MRDHKLAALKRWLTRDEPVKTTFMMPELAPIYRNATTNLYRVDGIFTTIAAATFLAFSDSTITQAGAFETPISLEHVYEIGLAKWQEQVESLQPTEFSKILSHGIDGLLSTYVVQGWTTFEVLATDTWVLALNKHPAILADLRELPAGKRCNYDVSSSMGDELKSRFHFASLSGIRDAYKAAFSEDFGSVLEPLYDPHLSAISSLRNVLVHRAGEADSRFVKETANIASVPDIAVGEQIKLDGELVVDLLLVGRDLAVKLFLAVDEWLATH